MLLPWEYGVRNLSRRPLRTALTLIALSTVILLVFVVVGFIRGLEKSLATSGDENVVLVYSINSEENIETSAISANVPALLAASNDAALKRFGIAYVSPEMYLGTRVSLGAGEGEGSLGLVRGVTMTAPLVRQNVKIVNGVWPATNEIMLGPLVAAKLGYSPEAQALKKGDPIAHLISIDAEISVKEAEAALATSMGNLNRSIAERRAAKARLEKPVHIQVRHADAKSSLAKAKTELTNLPFQIEAATANLGFASKSVTGKRAAGKATPGVVLQKAEAEFVAAGARLRELKQRKPSLAREIDALEEKVAAIGQQLNLLIEGKRQLDEATAGVQSATAMRDAAALRLQKAQLDLERNTVRAPMDGRVLRLIASPGSRVMGMETNGGHDSTAVVEMYDPQRLQVRADVRLEDVPLIQLGQPVKIETASSQNTIQGRVLQPNSSANIQKNTLEVKVELISPPATVRPEMLVTATFLAPKTETKPDESVQESNRIFIPSQLLESNDNGNSVWIVDANGHAKKQNCTLAGRPRGDELVEINNGLQVTDKLITSGTSDLHDGQRVNITGEDRSIGR